MSTDVVTLTNVRVATPELGPLSTFDPYDFRRPHPDAVPDGRSLLRQAWDDLAVRWLGYTVASGPLLVFGVRYWAAFAAVAPCAVACRYNYREHVANRAAHRAGRVWA